MANQNQQNDNSQRGGSGNFANNPEKASEAGKKGGQQSHGGSQDPGRQGQQGGTSKPGGQSGGSGNVADDRERASEAGRKGGQSSPGGAGKE
jgi:uncharacterized protein